MIQKKSDTTELVVNAVISIVILLVSGLVYFFCKDDLHSIPSIAQAVLAVGICIIGFRLILNHDGWNYPIVFLALIAVLCAGALLANAHYHLI